MKHLLHRGGIEFFFLYADEPLMFCLFFGMEGRKVRVKCEPDSTIGELKKLVAEQTGTRANKIRLQKSTTVFKDHITLE